MGIAQIVGITPIAAVTYVINLLAASISRCNNLTDSKPSKFRARASLFCMFCGWDGITVSDKVFQSDDDDPLPYLV